MFVFVQESVSVEGPSKQAHLEPTDTDSFRPTQTGHDVIEPHSSGERGQTKHLSNTAEQSTGKQLKKRQLKYEILAA